jgi:lipoprotein-anchoring transpeptidase ErfK/SrfK
MAARRPVRRIALTLALGGLLAAVAACSGSTGGGTMTQAAAQAARAGSPTAAGDPQDPASPAGPTTSNAAEPAAVVTASPAFGTDDVAPAAPVSVTVAGGTITDLTVTNPEGAEVSGSLSADKSTWTLSEPLGYSRDYTATGTAVGSDGRPVAIRGSWTTVTPVDQITTSISPGDGAVVGVAAPVIVHLGYEPADRALIEQHVKITTTPAVEGAWAWIQHDGDDHPSLDWRPNTQVHVESDIYGLSFGNGYYGGDNVTSDFTIGRNQVVLADANSHQIVVQRDGQTVATYDASYGSGDDIGDPNRVTRSGIHVVTDMQETTKMSNPAYGYTNVTEHWAVRISDNGEFIHQNQDTVGAQGSVNVSHGCINLSAESAAAYFASALIGDPVEVTGTSVELSKADGDVYDWTYSWDEWQALSAT